jgi:hypothetical protein
MLALQQPLVGAAFLHHLATHATASCMLVCELLLLDPITLSIAVH